MPERILRRVQVTGGSTFIVSLPKGWVRNIGLRAGDYVITQPQPDGSLRIMPAKGFKAKAFKTSLVIHSEMNPNAITREFVARYLAGYDIIKVTFEDRLPKHRLVIKDVLRKMIGVEIIEELADSIVVQCLAKPSELPVRVAIRRMANLAFYMLADFIKAMRTGNFQLLQGMRDRDDNVDRFYKFILRQLKMITLGIISPSDVGLNDLRECLGFRLVIKSIERIADHVVNASNCILQLNIKLDEATKESVMNFAQEVSQLFSKSVKSLFDLNVKLAHEVADSIDKIEEEENEIISSIMLTCKEIKCAVLLRLVIESLKRIADYSADIAEIAVNLAVEPPITSSGSQQSSSE